jgi:DNA modification methylase
MNSFTQKIVHLPPASLRPYPGNARVHSPKQLKQIVKSMQRFGFTNPVLISEDNEIIAGHGRAAAAKILGLETIPTIVLSHLSAAERRAYVLADNKLALNANWDKAILAIELQFLVDEGFDVEVAGFSIAEIDLTLDEVHESAVDGPPAREDEIPPILETAVSQMGDLWLLGRHRLKCGDARNGADYDSLLVGETVDLIFTDPPFNVPINGHVSGLGRVKHREFAMGAGEMSEEAFTSFLIETLGAAAKTCRDGAIAFVVMDWRHAGELISAGKQVFSEFKNLCVWNKTNGGMGTFYRSKHELVFVFKVGSAPHTNTFGLGDSGRYRTNVWDYPGISSISATRGEELAMHPTTKPTALVADAIRDCSKRGDIVLDAFAGSGTTLIAAEKCGRSARVIEFDPLYCDVIVRRYQRLTGKSALLSPSNESFEDVELRRAALLQIEVA